MKTLLTRIRQSSSFALFMAALFCQTAIGQSDLPETIELTATKVETLVAELDGGTGGLALDPDGNIYSADFGWRLGGRGKGGHQVFKITPDGKHSVFSTAMRGASGNTIDNRGNLFQSSIGGNFISKVTPEGKVTVICKQGLVNPVGLVIKGDHLYVCNCGSSSIQKVSMEGASEKFCASPLLKCPNGITLADDGNFYVACFMSGDVVKITPDGTASKLATLPGNNNGHITYFGGFLYVVARTANQIYRVSMDGQTKLFVGSGARGKTDGPPFESSLSLPNDLAITPDGKYMYINETGPIEGDPKILGPTRVRRVLLSRQNVRPNQDKELQADLSKQKVSIDDFAWIAGHWQGSAMGGQFEETWNPPMGGAMMGMFKFVNEKGIGFYEILTIAPKGDTFSLRLKHFHADLKGWEEKDETVEFPFIKVTDTEAVFNGIRFQKLGPDRMKVVVNVDRGGKKSSLTFECARVKETNSAKQP